MRLAWDSVRKNDVEVEVTSLRWATYRRSGGSAEGWRGIRRDLPNLPSRTVSKPVLRSTSGSSRPRASEMRVAAAYALGRCRAILKVFGVCVDWARENEVRPSGPDGGKLW